MRFLILTLATSPLREIFGLNLIRYRRYVLFHFTAYLVLDEELVPHGDHNEEFLPRLFRNTLKLRRRTPGVPQPFR